MASLGFSATKMFGSVWRFEPGEKALPAGLLWRGSEEPNDDGHGIFEDFRTLMKV